jgi:cyclase
MRDAAMSHERQALRAFNAAASALLVCLSIPAFAGPPWKVDDGFPTDWPTVQVKVTQLTSHLYLLHGSGSNTVASIGPDGTLLVDSEFAPVAPKLKLALDALGAKPVRVVIDTHYHPDHSGGNGAFSRDGAIVVAQENTRARLLASQYSYYWGRANNPPPPESLPTMTFDRALTLHFNGEEIKLIHNRPAHTDTDAIVYFRSSNVVLMGDLFLMGLYPYIDIQARGTIDGYFPALDEVLDMIDDKTKVVPGHGPVADRAQLKAYRDMLKTVRDRVAGQVSQGASLEQIIASHPSQEFDDAWASNRVGPEGFVAMIYQSLTGKRFEWQPEQPDPPAGSSANAEPAKAPHKD